MALRSLERTKLMFVKEQDARACSAVLKVRSVGASLGAPSARLELDEERRRPAPPNEEAAALNRVVSDSLKTEEKTSASFRTGG